MPIVRVAINIPVDTLFDYQTVDATPDDIGLRVSVPFGKKKVVGIIIAISDTTRINTGKLKPVCSIYRETKPLPASLLELFRFCSEYYHHPLGMVILNSLPAAMRCNKAIQIKKTASNLSFELTPAGKQIDRSVIPARNRVARRLFSAFLESAALTETQIKQISPRANQWLPEWLHRGWIAAKQAPADTSATVTGSIPILTAEQAAAVNAITAGLQQFNIWLLYGITGSGKTEVYLRTIESVLAQGKQTLVLIPEINLTPQLEKIFRSRFAATPIVSLHSGLNDSERLSGWMQAQSGAAKIILGTRLAVFTPLPDLGLIIVDEEQDSSFKQQDGLRYSARDMAIFRARQHAVTVILGSATPSLESYYNALNGRYHTLRLQSRAVRNAGLPSIHLIDTRIHKMQDGLTEPLINAIGRCLIEKNQSLIFINRRGYAPVLLCKSCGWSAACQRCSSRLVVHLRDKQLSCHHCGHQESFPRACPHCGNQDLAPFGQGTQRVEDALTSNFPAARILRIDRDSTRRKNAWHDMLQAIHGHQIDILIGTQLLSKGHDFPNLALVGIVSADNSLYSTDFRASERLFTQLMQVAGRAGRAQIAGTVLIQTEFPNHPLYQALQHHDYDGLAQILLSERKAAGFPPYVFQALLRGEAHDLNPVLNFLHQAIKLAKPPEAVELFDPVPAQMHRLKGLERAQLLIQSTSRKQLQAFLTEWCAQIHALTNHKVRWTLDVDPLEF
ncbi:primosomal protein N' [Nitrosomonas sp. sh817]|uniref:primosomal protein N' n=1 Tax=Nitrosomonas sp. sh817 TaxID=3070658 RepID=UPI0027DE84C7|nr:primosomal protein N' [Nitrosomonas sp. sh817]WMJ09961.1 primosomal protein N' [Nitrosomonas sp. sh817]